MFPQSYPTLQLTGVAALMSLEVVDDAGEVANCVLILPMPIG